MRIVYGEIGKGQTLIFAWLIARRKGKLQAVHHSTILVDSCVRGGLSASKAEQHGPNLNFAFLPLNHPTRRVNYGSSLLF